LGINRTILWGKYLKEIKAYCCFCETVTGGKVTAIKMLESGNYLYVGECSICCYEIKRIVPKSKEILEN
jgi:hypothetical protein